MNRGSNSRGPIRRRMSVRQPRPVEDCPSLITVIDPWSIVAGDTQRKSLPSHFHFVPGNVACNAPGRIRTCDHRFRKPMLYPLSYEG